MEITGVSAIPITVEPTERIYHAKGPFDERQLVIVKVETDAGPVGIGEAGYWGGPNTTTTTIVEDELAEQVVGEDPRYPERIWETLYMDSYFHGRRGAVIMGISGIDMAVWDAYGKIVGEPVHRLLGGFTDRVKAYASAGYYTDGDNVSRLRDEMDRHLADGFTAVKMKVGRSTDSTEIQNQYTAVGPASRQLDVQRVRAARDALGDEVALMIDPNNGWDRKTTIRMAERLADENLYFIEEPIPTDDKRGLQRVNERVTVPVAGCETAYTRYEYRELIENDCVDIVQPGVTWVGGLTEARRVAAIAAAHNKPVVPHSFNSILDLLGGVHLTCSIPNGEFVEYDRTVTNTLTTDLPEEPLPVDDEGYVHPPAAPGLGVELDTDYVETHRDD